MMIAGDKHAWQKEPQKTSNLSEIQKGIPHLHPITIPDCHEKIGIARKQSEISENLGLPENSQRLATPRSQPLGLVQSNLRENEEMSFE